MSISQVKHHWKLRKSIWEQHSHLNAYKPTQRWASQLEWKKKKKKELHIVTKMGRQGKSTTILWVVHTWWWKKKEENDYYLLIWSRRGSVLIRTNRFNVRPSPSRRSLSILACPDEVRGRTPGRRTGGPGGGLSGWVEKVCEQAWRHKRKRKPVTAIGFYVVGCVPPGGEGEATQRKRGKRGRGRKRRKNRQHETRAKNRSRRFHWQQFTTLSPSWAGIQDTKTIYFCLVRLGLNNFEPRFPFQPCRSLLGGFESTHIALLWSDTLGKVPLVGVSLRYRSVRYVFEFLNS